MKPIFIDGSSMLVTAYYGNLPKEILYEKDEEKRQSFYHKIMKTSTGVYTNAIYTMIKQLLKIFKVHHPSHIVFAFDKTRNTFRKELYSDYKGTRKETPEPLKMQFIEMEKILTELKFPVLIHDQYEADDLIGSAIRHFRDVVGNNTVYIITKDHDYLQLVDESTRLWLIQMKQEAADELNKKYFGEQEHLVPDKAFEVTHLICKEEYGIVPELVPDLKGIAGDTSDNIPGVKGVSDKTAIPLLTEYGSLENLYSVIEACTTEQEKKDLSDFWKQSFGVSRSPIKSLLEQKESAILSKNLATIRTDIDLDLTEEDMKYTTTRDDWNRIFEQYEFKSFLNNSELFDQKPKKKGLFSKIVI